MPAGVLMMYTSKMGKIKNKNKIENFEIREAMFSILGRTLDVQL